MTSAAIIPLKPPGLSFAALRHVRFRWFVGNSYQAQMPNFAHDLGHAHPGAAYSMVLAADAAGALTAGFCWKASTG